MFAAIYSCLRLVTALVTLSLAAVATSVLLAGLLFARPQPVSSVEASVSYQGTQAAVGN